MARAVAAVKSSDQLEPIAAFENITAKDLKEAASKLGVKEARYLVDLYYQIQEFRKATGNQIRSLGAQEPGLVIKEVFATFERVEGRIRKELDYYSTSEPTGMGTWAKSIPGIGPVLAAGLLAHIDMTRSRTAGAVHRFAGLDSTVTWFAPKDLEMLINEARNSEADDWHAFIRICRAANYRPGTVLRNAKLTEKFLSIDEATLVYSQFNGDRTAVTKIEYDGDNMLLHLPDPAPAFASVYGEKFFIGRSRKSSWEAITKVLGRRPWNGRLRTICWLLGESFVKVSNNPKSQYGRLYQERKAIEIEHNLRGDYADQARKALIEKKYKADSDAKLWYQGCLTADNARTYYATPSDERLGLSARLAGDPGTGLPMLPPAHIHSRAKRWAVKLFLSHYFEEGCRRVLHREPPVIYSIAMLNHLHRIEHEPVE